MKRYRRSALMEPFRKFCRAVDLLILLHALRRRGRLPGFSGLRAMTYVEMGPGPMRLATLKRALFRQVCFFDISDFGIPDPRLRIVDIEKCADAQILVSHLPDPPQSGRVLLFADHCLEHISQEVLIRFIRSIVDNGFTASFRVPNILSPTGQQNYAGDSTHRTSFDPKFRREMESFGFSVFPWIRWYRPRLAARALFGGTTAMAHAEEIVLSAACRRPAPILGTFKDPRRSKLA